MSSILKAITEAQKNALPDAEPRVFFQMLQADALRMVNAAAEMTKLAEHFDESHVEHAKQTSALAGARAKDIMRFVMQSVLVRVDVDSWIFDEDRVPNVQQLRELIRELSCTEGLPIVD